MAFMVAALVAACGGGGGGGGVTGASGAASNTANATKTYLFYQGSDLTLTAVDPVTGVSSPVATGIVAASSASASSVVPSSPSTIRGGTFSAGTISDLHTQALVYSSASKLWQVSAIAGAAAPAPTQVSNMVFGAAGTSTAYCYSFTEADFATPANSAIIIGQAGTDLKCNTADDLASVTTLGANATTAPIALAAGARALGAVHNPSTGAISGALLLVPTAPGALTSNLMLTGPTLNPVGAVTVLTGVTTASTGVLSTSATGKKLMMISGALWKYDPAVAVSAANPAAVGYTFTTGAAHILSDGTNTYFVDNLSFYRVPMDGSAGPTLMYTAPAGTSFGNVMLTSNYIVYAWKDATNNGVSSLPKTAVSGTLPTGFLSSTNANYTTFTGATYVLHSTSGTAVNFSDLFGGLAYHCNEDGTGQVQYGSTTMGSIWWGRVEPTTQTVGISDGSFSARAFLYSTTYSATTLAPLTDALDSYDPASGALAANLGTWPAGAISAVQGSEYIANNGATIYFLNDVLTAPYYANPFLLNVNASNSLKQLTNTPTINETRVGGGGY